MPQRQIVWAQLAFDRRPEGPGLDSGGSTGRVDLEYRAHGGGVHCDRWPVEPRLDAADYRTAAAVRDDRNALVRRPVEHVDHVLLAARSHDKIGHVVEAAVQVAHDVA